eukprot:CAMPEP_0116923934 /NCGR_PEP_ID=MMETSP0467-20121206/23198_1 /TAXON_ID=283647 /ORGANISM="Mesodinium pulex, Strain SPMC105" /LENGTH=157 /DNA_ID=CAMNT_0004602641 /DNA_START=677 /DNA_END=1152 /DNA_ORIENTATION=-
MARIPVTSSTRDLTLVLRVRTRVTSRGCGTKVNANSTGKNWIANLLLLGLDVLESLGLLDVDVVVGGYVLDCLLVLHSQQVAHGEVEQQVLEHQCDAEPPRQTGLLHEAAGSNQVAPHTLLRLDGLRMLHQQRREHDVGDTEQHESHPLPVLVSVHA